MHGAAARPFEELPRFCKGFERIGKYVIVFLRFDFVLADLVMFDLVIFDGDIKFDRLSPLFKDGVWS